MVSFIGRFKMATIDKRITSLLRQSTFFADYNSRTYYTRCAQSGSKESIVNHIKTGIDVCGVYWPPLESIDRSEEWVVEADRFLSIAWKDSSIEAHFHARGLTFEDAVDMFLVMTIATMPNPLFKTGPGRLTNTLVATSVYQEPKTKLAPCLDALRAESLPIEKVMYGKCSQAIPFARQLKEAHELAFGAIGIDDVL
ncbi:MAG: hypothetical protein ACE361_26300 [Aureliella sp.]